MRANEYEYECYCGLVMQQPTAAACCTPEAANVILTALSEWGFSKSALVFFGEARAKGLAVTLGSSAAALEAAAAAAAPPPGPEEEGDLLSTRNVAMAEDGRFHCCVEGCDKSFSLRTNLRRHMIGEHASGKKRHICPVCAAEYSRSDDLKSHLKAHRSDGESSSTQRAVRPRLQPPGSSSSREAATRAAAAATANSTPSAAAASASASSLDTNPTSSAAAVASATSSSSQLLPPPTSSSAASAAAGAPPYFSAQFVPPSSVTPPSAPPQAPVHLHGVQCGHVPLLFDGQLAYLMHDGLLARQDGEMCVLPVTESQPHSSCALFGPGAPAPAAAVGAAAGPSSWPHESATLTPSPRLVAPSHLSADSRDWGPLHEDGAQHLHGEDCGHPLVRHGSHFDYLVGRNLHHQHVLSRPIGTGAAVAAPAQYGDGAAVGTHPVPSSGLIPALLPSASASPRAAPRPASSPSPSSSSSAAAIGGSGCDAQHGEEGNRSLGGGGAAFRAPSCRGHTHTTSQGMRVHCDWHGTLDRLADDDLLVVMELGEMLQMHQAAGGQELGMALGGS